MTGWSFYAVGLPAPQGSKSVKGRTKTGHVILTESSKAVKPWREAVKHAAPAVTRPLDGPLLVYMIFTMPRPKSATKTDIWPYRTPDLSKLARSTEDAITEAGLWADDARVSGYARLAKVWWGYDTDAIPTPGAVIAAIELGEHCDLDLEDLYTKAKTEAIQRIRGAA